MKEETQDPEAQDYLQSLAREIFESLAFEEVFIVEVEETRFHSLVSFGTYPDDLRYDGEISVSPCRDIFKKKILWWPNDIQKAFPEDRWLSEQQISSGAAAALFDPAFRPIGVILTVSRQPIGSSRKARSQLASFAQRVASEMVRRQVEADLHQERYLLHILMENVPDHLYFKDLNSRFTRINMALAKWFGLNDPSEAVGKSDFDFFSKEVAQHAYEDEQKIITSGRPVIGQTECQKWPNGKPDTWVSTTKLPLRDRAGRIVGTCGLSRDITAQRQAEDLLRKAFDDLEIRVQERTLDLSKANEGMKIEIEERHKAEGELMQQQKLFVAGPTIVFKWRAKENWPVEYVSPNITQFGYLPEDLTSGRIQYADIVHPDDLSRIVAEVQTFSQSNASFFEQEYRIRHANGVYRWVYDFTIIVRNPASAVTHYHGYVMDITARKMAEEALKESQSKYEAVVGAFDGLIYICSTDYRLEFMNKRLAEQIGSPAAGEYCYKAIYGRDSTCPWCINDSVRQNKTIRWETVNPSDKRWKYIVSAPIHHANGQTSMMFMIQDITERKLAEETLRRREAILEAVGFASEQMIKSSAWDQGIQAVLMRLAQAMSIGRAYLFQNGTLTDGTVRTGQRFEWTAPGVASRMYNSELQDFSMSERGLGRWEDTLSRGQIIDGDAREFAAEERGLLLTADVRSILVLPIFVEKQWWGFIGFDACSEEREWSPVEVEALKTAASLLGSAIEHGRFEESIKKSEERNRTILNAIPDLMFRIRKDGVFLDFKAERESDLAVAPDRIIGHKIAKILPANIAQQAIFHIQEALRTGQKQIYEYQLAKGSDLLHFETRMVVSGKDEVLALVRDVTERARTEAALKESKRRLMDMFNFLPDATFAIDREGKVIAWNRALEILTGIPASDMIGKGDYEYATPFYGDRKPMLLNVLMDPNPEREKQYRYLEKTKDTWIAEDYLTALKTGPIYVWATATPMYDEQGHIVGAIESLRDITQRQRKGQ